MVALRAALGVASIATVAMADATMPEVLAGYMAMEDAGPCRDESGNKLTSLKNVNNNVDLETCEEMCSERAHCVGFSFDTVGGNNPTCALVQDGQISQTDGDKSEYQCYAKCPVDTYGMDGVCVACGGGSTTGSSIGQTECSCGSGEAWNKNANVCMQAPPDVDGYALLEDEINTGACRADGNQLDTLVKLNTGDEGDCKVACDASDACVGFTFDTDDKENWNCVLVTGKLIDGIEPGDTRSIHCYRKKCSDDTVWDATTKACSPPSATGFEILGSGACRAGGQQLETFAKTESASADECGVACKASDLCRGFTFDTDGVQADWACVLVMGDVAIDGVSVDDPRGIHCYKKEEVSGRRLLR